MDDINEKCNEAMKVFFQNFDNDATIMAMAKEKLVQQQKQALQELSQHMHMYAFAYVWLCSNRCGLLEALLHDKMLPSFMMFSCMYLQSSCLP